ncbi:nucleoside phosphatase family-domain-containing protein [Mycena sanguinolenta]|nr:nucleoside phosphatase family-domain-containing protein [Mycena sanguinolenta]
MSKRSPTPSPTTEEASANSSATPSPPSTTHPRTRKMAPMSPTYDRLEAGARSPTYKMSFGKGNGKQRRFGWKKFALGAGVLLVLVWVFVPREQRGLEMPSWSGASGDDRETGHTPYEGRPPTGSKDTNTKADPNPNPITTRPPAPPSSGSEDVKLPPSPPSTSHPATYDSDPDPSSTTHCTSPFDPSSPIVQYALMLDAGSTGSRIHIYKFNNCARTPSYEWEVFKQTAPGTGGLSAFAGRPADAAASLASLLNEAVRVVPTKLRGCTPVALRATAGLRALPGTEASDILKEVRRMMSEEYPFKVVDGEDGVGIMAGAEEGVFAWVTANYLLGALSPSEPEAVGEHDQTYAVLDLGGGSTQIVFAPALAPADAPPAMLPGEHRYELEFAGTTRALYQHSYLGWGLMSARARVHRVVGVLAPAPASSHSGDALEVIHNACLARGMERVVELPASLGAPARNVTMSGGSVGSFDACRRLVEIALEKDAPCPVGPCSFGGVYQPNLLDVFPSVAGESRGRVLLLSYFYDRVAPLVRPAPGLKEDEGGVAEGEITATIDTFADLARTVCQGRDAWLGRWGTHVGLMKELEGRPEWCLDLTWMWGVLRVGYEFADDRKVLFGKQIDGTELGWCLGAGIKLVSGGSMQCREI